MFRPFRFLARRQAADAAPPDSEGEEESYNRAWADYVEWSGLDEEGLPEASCRGERP